MASHVNSQKKVDYANLISEVLIESKKKIVSNVEDIHTQCGVIRMAVTDRAYNNMVNIAAVQINAIDTLARSIANDIIEPLTKSTIYGQALVEASKKALPNLEAVEAIKFDSIPFEASVIESRGLDENWTDATREAFAEACKTFIQVRYNLMIQIGELTNKCSEEDMKDTYREMGIAFETICNSTVDVYTKMKDELEQAGILVAKDIATAETAVSHVSSVGLAERGKDILGTEADV
jgi:hypothetical protein